VAHMLALDQGTTSSRAIVFDDRGMVVASAQREFAQHYPQPGWGEHDPETLWRTQSAVAVEALAHASIGARDVAALGIANQRETRLLWERRTGEAVAPAIVWQDVTEIASLRGAERRFESAMVPADAEAIRTRRREAVARGYGWIAA
jgi:glycerol kinase